MEVTEFEEGEARFDANDDNIDPDIALSYIDKRLENVMGHFQKEFEGLVSTELLGPLNGAYGSFLPTQKHPSTNSHNKTLPKALNSNKPFPFDNLFLEVAALNPVIPVGPVRPAATSNHQNVVLDQKVLSVNDLVSKDISKNEIASNLGEKRSLKVRIKVGNNRNNNKSTRKNVEIYSGLGLSSSSSSMGNNLEDSCGPSIESHDLILNSPESILRDMTTMFVPGNRLLSPLSESLFHLRKMEIKTNSSIFVDEKKQMEKKEANFEDKKGLTNDCKVKLSSDSIITSEAVKKVLPVKKRETQRELIEDKLFTSKESDGNYKQKNVKNLICKNGPDVTKHETDLFEDKVGPKTTTNHESYKVKVPQSVDKQPFERKSRLIGSQSSNISNEKSKLKSKYSLSGVMEDKKIALKDIVKVRNSYKDILDTNVDAQNMPAGNEVVKGTHVADVAVPQKTEMGPTPQDNWAGCDRCEKWRLLPIGVDPENLPEKWLCSMSTWLPGRNSCDISEDETTRAVQELNLIHLISQNQKNLQVNNVNFDHMNLNVNSKIMVNRLKNNKYRPENRSSGVMEASHSSMEHRQNRKSLSGTNQLLIEKNVVNKPIDVGKHAAKVNGGDPNTKKLKRKIGSDQYDSVNLNNFKTESEPKGNLVISVKKESESSQISMQNNKLLDKLHAKKRKLQESQPLANTLESSEDRLGMNQKRLKTNYNIEVKDKVKTMKIRLSASSSSRRISLQERKGSPVGSVSSSPKRSLNRIKSGPTTEIPKSQRLGGNSQTIKHDTLKSSDTLLKKVRKVEVNIDQEDSSAGKKIPKKHVESESKLGETSNSEMNLNVEKDLKKVFVENSKKEVEMKMEVSSSSTAKQNESGQNKSKIIKLPEDSSKTVVTDCGPVKDLGVTSFLKEYSSSQTALTAFKSAEESKDYADHIKVSGFGYECTDAYFDSALKFLYAASLLEACNADVSESKGIGVDPMSVYSTCAKLSKICGEEYEKRKELGATCLAYKCIEVAYMRIVYFKSLVTKQDLQMVTQGESPSSSASDVDNLNNQAITLDKTKSIGNHVVARNQPNFMRLLDFTNDVSFAMEASMKSQNAYKSAIATLEQDQIVLVKRAVDFSFQDVKEIICLVQNAREAINRQCFKGNTC